MERFHPWPYFSRSRGPVKPTGKKSDGNHADLFMGHKRGGRPIGVPVVALQVSRKVTRGSPFVHPKSRQRIRDKFVRYDRGGASGPPLGGQRRRQLDQTLSHFFVKTTDYQRPPPCGITSTHIPELLGILLLAHRPRSEGGLLRSTGWSTRGLARRGPRMP